MIKISRRNHQMGASVMCRACSQPSQFDIQFEHECVGVDNITHKSAVVITLCEKCLNTLVTAASDDFVEIQYQHLDRK